MVQLVSPEPLYTCMKKCLFVRQKKKKKSLQPQEFFFRFLLLMHEKVAFHAKKKKFAFIKDKVLKNLQVRNILFFFIILKLKLIKWKEMFCLIFTHISIEEIPIVFRLFLPLSSKSFKSSCISKEYKLHFFKQNKVI